MLHEGSNALRGPDGAKGLARFMPHPFSVARYVDQHVLNMFWTRIMQMDHDDIPSSRCKLVSDLSLDHLDCFACPHSHGMLLPVPQGG